MNWGELYTCDVANGPGMRVTLFVSGCRHHCKDCFNECAWDFGYGKSFAQETVDKVIELLKPDYISGLTLLGGEPLEPENQADVEKLVRAVKSKYGDKKSIWLYSGFTYEEITGEKQSRCNTSHTDGILNNIDVLVDGKFIAEEKDVTLNFRGSRNQRIIDVAKSYELDAPVLLEY